MRWGLLALLLTWMIAGPVYRQALGGTNKLLPAWHMYRGFGAKVWRVQIVEQTPSGPVPVDRIAELGYDDWRSTPLSVRRITQAAQLEAQLAHLCSGKDRDLRVVAWRGRVWGWEPLDDGSRNRCR